MKTLASFLNTVLASFVTAGLATFVGAVLWWAVNGWTDVVTWSAVWTTSWALFIMVFVLDSPNDE